MPNNRQWAALVWLFIVIGFLLARRDTRQMVTGLLRQLCEPKILVPVLLFAGYCAGVIAAGAALGGWTLARTADTVVWFGGAVALLFRANEVARERRFIRHSVVEPMRVAAIIVFFVGLFPLPLWAELLLLPLVVLAVGLSVVATGRRKDAAAKRLVDSALTAGGIALLGWAAYRTIEDWGVIDSADTTRALLLPMWATAAVVPVVYLFSVLMGYEEAAWRIGEPGARPRNTWRALAAVASVLRLRVRDIAAFDAYWGTRVAEAGSFGAARVVAAEFRQSLREKEDAKRCREERLRAYAGVPGADEEGQQLDQREFDVTRHALQRLATVQMGCYHNRARYQPEALDLAGPSGYGLPADHGVRMKVRDDGQAWCAWRRTPSGWCLGIGATAPPPNQWLGDGPQPPRGFPGLDPWWGSGPFGIDAANW
jgi:hypothetical protein